MSLLYRNYILSLAPLMYWRLGETAGNTAVDETGTQNGSHVNGVDPGAAGLITGDPDRAADYDGVNDFTSFSGLGWSGPGVTVAAWIRPRSFNLAEKNSLIFWGDNNPQFVFLHDEGSFQFATWDGSALRGTSSPTLPPLDETSLVAGVFDDTIQAYQYYLNGELLSESSNIVPFDSLAGLTNLVGRNPGLGGRWYWDGIIDEVALWNRALTANEIKRMHALGKRQDHHAPSAGLGIHTGL